MARARTAMISPNRPSDMLTDLDAARAAREWADLELAQVLAKLELNHPVHDP